MSQVSQWICWWLISHSSFVFLGQELRDSPGFSNLLDPRDTVCLRSHRSYCLKRLDILFVHMARIQQGRYINARTPPCAHLVLGFRRPTSQIPRVFEQHPVQRNPLNNQSLSLQ